MNVRTNIVLNSELIAKGKKLTGIKTSRELVEHALSELIRMEKQRDIRNLRGKIEWQGDLHEMRKARTFR
jgi:Arc/MetJ family transcription regulator